MDIGQYKLVYYDCVLPVIYYKNILKQWYNHIDEIRVLHLFVSIGF